MDTEQNPCHYFAVKHDLRSNEFKTPDALEQKQYKPLILDWLCRRYQLQPFKHSFKDQWISYIIWGDKLSISFDFRVEDQKELFDLLPNEIKGTKQHGTGKIVNLKSLYFTVSDLVKFEYPTIINQTLWHTEKSKDNDGDTCYSYTYKIHLSDGTIIYHLNQELNKPISMQHTFPATIQERAFLKYISGI